jgi:hypothetical protein
MRSAKATKLSIFFCIELSGPRTSGLETTIGDHQAILVWILHQKARQTVVRYRLHYRRATRPIAPDVTRCATR